jgi:hypothetical protein
MWAPYIFAGGQTHGDKIQTMTEITRTRILCGK